LMRVGVGFFRTIIRLLMIGPLFKAFSLIPERLERRARGDEIARSVPG
jgi:hypothetical protein